MSIIWTNGFEDAPTGSINFDPNFGLDKTASLGWEYFNTGTVTVASASGISMNNSTGYRSGISISLNGFSSDTASGKMFIGRRVTANATSYGIGFNLRSTSATAATSLQTNAFGFWDDSGNNLYVRVNASGILTLYHNGTLAATGTFDVVTGQPWVHVEIRVVGNTTFEVWVNNTLEMTHTGAAFNATSFRIWSDKTSGSVNFQWQFDDFISYINRARVGASKCYGYFRGGDVAATFNDTFDNGSSATTAVGVFTGESYRSSSTRGHQDIFNYTNVLPAGTDFTSILAVNQITFACSAGMNGGALERLVVSGGNTYAQNVSNEMRAYVGKRFNRIMENDPATSAPWTATDARNIQTGYRIPQYGQTAFTTQPSSTGTSGVNLAVQPVVQVQTSAGALDTSYNGPVCLYANGNGRLNSLGVVNAVAGVATFSGIALIGTGVSTLTAVVKGRSPATSNNITIS